ncbi:hypothetical protein ASD28_25375 [Massilia sp. Root133]|uniref:hypothetical protein n=1 Tax=unclassified Massilia TaxID=2609279 RepID=UPI0006F3077A|nr:MULTISPECIES: hypothetical protein [unclassified Massilia]KQY14844.1 hypothetical protein ASD28_25375 [Massilia sp. Root133]
MTKREFLRGPSSRDSKSMRKKLLAIGGAIVMSWLALVVNAVTSPVVFLHYSADAVAPVTYFFNEDNDIVKDHLGPGASIEFRTARRLRISAYSTVIGRSRPSSATCPAKSAA